MCVGVPGTVVSLSSAQPDVAMVDLQGVPRRINIGLLDAPPEVGSWVLVHLGFAMETMTHEEADAALAFMPGTLEGATSATVDQAVAAIAHDPFLPDWVTEAQQEPQG